MFAVFWSGAHGSAPYTKSDSRTVGTTAHTAIIHRVTVVGGASGDFRRFQRCNWRPRTSQTTKAAIVPIAIVEISRSNSRPGSLHHVPETNPLSPPQALVAQRSKYKRNRVSAADEFRRPQTSSLACGRSACEAAPTRPGPLRRPRCVSTTERRASLRSRTATTSSTRRGTVNRRMSPKLDGSTCTLRRPRPLLSQSAIRTPPQATMPHTIQVLGAGCMSDAA